MEPTIIAHGGAGDKSTSEEDQELLEEETGRYAGIIVIDEEGRTGSDHNAREMRTASRGT